MFQSPILKTNVEIWTELSTMNNKNQESRDEEWLARLEAYVVSNLQTPGLINEQVATHLNISIAQLYRKLNRLLGTTPNLYVRNIRLRIAYEILNEGGATKVSEVAYKVGFNRVDYFSKLFEIKYGVRPKILLKR